MRYPRKWGIFVCLVIWNALPSLSEGFLCVIITKNIRSVTKNSLILNTKTWVLYWKSHNQLNIIIIAKFFCIIVGLIFNQEHQPPTKLFIMYDIYISYISIFLTYQYFWGAKVDVKVFYVIVIIYLLHFNSMEFMVVYWNGPRVLPAKQYAIYIIE